MRWWDGCQGNLETRACRHTWLLIPGSTFNWSAWMLETLKPPRKMTIDRSIKCCWGWFVSVVLRCSLHCFRRQLPEESSVRIRNVLYHTTDVDSDVDKICSETCLCDDDVIMHWDLGFSLFLSPNLDHRGNSIKVCDVDVCHEMMKMMKTCKIGFGWCDT